MEVANLKSDNSVISDYQYAYDAISRRTHVLENSGDRVTWRYDASSQLINENRSGANAFNTTFTYDPVGNRLSRTQGISVDTYVYDGADQLSSVNGVKSIYTFDQNGNQHILDSEGEITTWSWDFENQNTLVELPDGTRVTMAYNANNRRVRKTT